MSDQEIAGKPKSDERCLKIALSEISRIKREHHENIARINRAHIRRLWLIGIVFFVPMIIQVIRAYGS